MYKFIKSSFGRIELSFGYERNLGRKQAEKLRRAFNPPYKNIRGKFDLRIFLKVICGFAEHQESATYGLGYWLSLKVNT